MEQTKYESLKNKPRKMQIDSLRVGPNQQRVFTVDLSKHEYTAGKVEREFDYFTIFVYTPEMIVIEKLRALCQQMPEYEHKTRSNARARDFYDIHRVVTILGIDLLTPACVDLFEKIFAAKQVPLKFLARIWEFRESHRPDWPSVQDSVNEPVEDFDVYFDFVVEQVKRLESLWIK